VFSSIDPNFFMNRVLSTALIWSKSISPFLFLNLHFILHGKSKPLVVIGATRTVDNAAISFGEMTTQGLVLFISLPLVGFKLMSQI